MTVSCADCGAKLIQMFNAWFGIGKYDRCRVTGSPYHRPRPVDLARIRYEDAKAATREAVSREASALSEYSEALADLELGEDSEGHH